MDLPKSIRYVVESRSGSSNVTTTFLPSAFTIGARLCGGDINSYFINYVTGEGWMNDNMASIVLTCCLAFFMVGRFARVAMECGVPEMAILMEPDSTNTAENILFTRRMLEEKGIAHDRILGVHQPFMERRITAAMGVYWPEQDFRVTSPQTSIADYLADAKRQGVTENAAVSVIVGDFQRMDLYAKKGYQIPQYIPPEAWDAFHRLVKMGYDKQLAK